MTMTISGSGTITGLSAGGLPSASITQANVATPLAGTGPAFSAYLGTNQSISTGTYTKVTLDTEVFDTNSNFASSRFTPTVAGYYQLTGALIATATGTSITICQASIYKNGSLTLAGGPDPRGLTLTSTAGMVNGLVYLNGTTDYVEMYAYISATSPVIYAGSSSTYFQGSMVRAA